MKSRKTSSIYCPTLIWGQGIFQNSEAASLAESCSVVRRPLSWRNEASSLATPLPTSTEHHESQSSFIFVLWPLLGHFWRFTLCSGPTMSEMVSWPLSSSVNTWTLVTDPAAGGQLPQPLLVGENLRTRNAEMLRN